MRILQMTGTLGWLGMEASVMNLYRHIDRDKFQFDFISCSMSRQRYDDEVEEMGGKIHRLPSRSSHPHLYFVKLLKLLRDSDYEVFHIHSNSAGLFVDALAARMAGIRRVIAHSHNSSSIRKIQHYIFKPFLPCVVGSRLACSEEAANWMYGSTNDAKILINGIDPDRYRFSEVTRNKFRESFGLEDEYVIGHVVSFTEIKNQRFLVDLLRELRDKGFNFKVVLIGDGPLRREIFEYALSQGVGDFVLFLGNRPDVPEVLSAFDFFVFPSLYEGLPLAPIEAQFSGLMCLLSDAVPNVSCLPENVNYLPLNSELEVWVRAVLDKLSYKRVDVSERVIGSKWDIRNTAKELELFYENLIHHKW